MVARRARLRVLKPGIATVDAGLGRQTDEAGHNTALEPWRRWYWTAAWRRLRTTIFVRDHYTCRMCDQVHLNATGITADHIEPHRGDERRFWDPANVQTLCTSPCHVKHKQRLEARAR